MHVFPGRVATGFHRIAHRTRAPGGRAQRPRPDAVRCRGRDPLRRRGAEAHRGNPGGSRQPSRRGGAGGCRDPHRPSTTTSRTSSRNCQKGQVCDPGHGRDAQGLRPAPGHHVRDRDRRRGARAALRRRDVVDTNNPNPRVASELEGMAVLGCGCRRARRAGCRRSTDTAKQGLISPYIDIARQKGVVALCRRWRPTAGPRPHVSRCGEAVRARSRQRRQGSPLSRRRRGGESRHGTSRRVVAAGLGLPAVSLSGEEVQAHFGWFAMFAGLDLRASGRVDPARSLAGNQPGRT